MSLLDFFDTICFESFSDIIILDEEDVCLMYFGYNQIPSPFMFEMMLEHPVKSVQYGFHLVVRIDLWNLPF